MLKRHSDPDFIKLKLEKDFVWSNMINIWQGYIFIHFREYH